MDKSLSFIFVLACVIVGGVLLVLIARWARKKTPRLEKMPLLGPARRFLERADQYVGQGSIRWHALAQICPRKFGKNCYTVKMERNIPVCVLHNKGRAAKQG